LTAIPQAWRPSHFVDDFPEGRRQAPRCEVKLRVSLRCDPASTEVGNATAAELIGETRDLSEIGLAVRVPSNHSDHRYLNVVGTSVQLTLDLPTGPVSMLATPRWCQTLSAEDEAGTNLIGLRITKMSDEAWVALVRYVHARV
jgi:PilZ domain